MNVFHADAENTIAFPPDVFELPHALNEFVFPPEVFEPQFQVLNDFELSLWPRF